MTYLFEAIKPTRIYHKQCSHCGLNYLGKSTLDKVEDYPGSGVYWQSHLKKHEAESIHIWNSDWFYDTSIVEYALGLSEELNIVESKEWANLKPENGLDGGDNSEFIDYNNVYKSLVSTMLEKYGVDSFSKTNEGRMLISKRMKENNSNGVMNHSKMKETRNSEEWKNGNGVEWSNNISKTLQERARREDWDEIDKDRRNKIAKTNSSKSKRPIVLLIKELKKKKDVPLKRGWYQKKDEELTIIYEKYKDK